MSTDSLDTTLSARGLVAPGIGPAPAEKDTTAEVLGRKEITIPKKSNLGERLVSLFSPLLLLLLWEIMVRIRLLDARFFPAPSSIVGTFRALVVSNELLIDVKATLGRIAVGLLMGVVPGLLLGVCMGLSSPVRAFFKPMVAALFPIPKIAILPLIMLIFGLGEMSKYVSVAIGVIFLVLINTMAGVMNIDKIYLDVGRNFGANRWQFFRTIAVPGALPQIFTGFQLSLGVALIVIVATEFVGAKTGIGYLIWQSWQTFSVEAMYCGLVTTAFLGFLSQLGLDTVQRLVIPWKPELH
ncbi:MAG TPA: ABC transporter permease [Chloroflexota bacterium]|jgi:NitT/TauT family transport system permease protein|nr:ABC transporter permease [Chloroflexota bacterium]